MPSTIGEAFIKIRADTSQFNSELKQGTGASFNQVATLAGAALSVVGGFATKLSQDLIKAHDNLKVVIENTGANFKDYAGQVDKAVASEEKFGHSSVDTQDALAKLTIRLGDPTKALEQMHLVAEVAAFKNISLADSADLVGKVMQGNGRILKQFGIDAKDASGNAKDSTELAIELGNKLNGVAEAQSKTLEGHVKSIKVQIQDLIAQSSTWVGPILTATGATISVVSNLVTVLDSAAAAAIVDWVAMAAAATASAIATAAAWLVAMGPFILIAAAIALAVYEIITHWKEVKEFAIKIFGEVEAFFKKWWPEILAVMTLGVSAIVTFFVKHWDEIYNDTIKVFTGIINWFKTNFWEIMGAIATLGLNVVAGLFVRHWRQIVEDTKKAFDEIVNFFKELPGRIEGLLVGLFNLNVRIWTDIVHVYERAISDIGTALSKLPGLLQRWFDDAFNAAKRAVIAGITAVIGFFVALPGRIIGAIGDLGSKLFNIGLNAIEGLLHGLQRAWNDVTGWLSKAASSLPSIAKKVLGINSPSKAFQDIGESIVQGLNIGLSNGTGSTQAAMKKLLAIPQAGYNAQINSANPNTNSGTVGPLVHIENANIRSQQDITDLARQIYKLQAKGQRGSGLQVAPI